MQHDDDTLTGATIATLQPEPAVRVLMIGRDPVMLAADVARAFGVETREVVQAIRRNPHKFGAMHVFQLSDADVQALRSQGVISGRGWAPTVLTQKGVVRLATVLTAPKALEATDQMIDLFLGIYGQLKAGRHTVEVANADHLIAQPEDVDQIRKLRRRVAKAIGDLLDTTIDAKRHTTVADALGGTAAGVLDQLDAWMKSPRIKNEQIAAETLKIIEQTRDIYERRQADLERSSAETERILLDNVKTKIELVEKLLAMTDKLEPGTLAQVLPHFADARSSLAPAKQGKG